MAIAIKIGKKQLAFHEAGHAVVARLLGIGIDHAAARESLMGGGYVLNDSAAWKNRDGGIPDQITGLEKDIKISLAGMVAQNRYHPFTTAQQRKLTQDSPRGGWYSDWRGALSGAVQIVFLRHGLTVPPPGPTNLDEAQDNEVTHLLEQLTEETRVMVKENWSAIESVAAALLDRPFLTQKDIDTLIAEARGANHLDAADAEGGATQRSIF